MDKVRAKTEERPRSTPTFENLSYSQATLRRDLNPDEVSEKIRSEGEKHQAKLDRAYATLQEKILQADPVVLLANFVFYGIFTPLDKDRDLLEERIVGSPYAELLQALALRHP